MVSKKKKHSQPAWLAEPYTIVERTFESRQVCIDCYHIYHGICALSTSVCPTEVWQNCPSSQRHLPVVLSLLISRQIPPHPTPQTLSFLGKFPGFGGSKQHFPVPMLGWPVSPSLSCHCPSANDGAEFSLPVLGWGFLPAGQGFKLKVAGNASLFSLVVPAPLLLIPGEWLLLLHDKACQNFANKKRKIGFSAAFFLVDTVRFLKKKINKKRNNKTNNAEKTQRSFSFYWA